MTIATERAALANLIARAKREHFTTGSRPTDPQVLGVLISRFFQWDGVSILRTAEAGLEDANFHTEAGEVAAMANKYDPPFDPKAPIDDETRKALFASLREHYGRNLDRDERIRKVNVLLGLADGERVYSFSRAGNMTMGHARRVFDILAEL